MLSTLRKRVKIIMFIVAAAFIAGFLLSELWTLIRSRERGGHPAAPPGVVGQIGDHQIKADEYRQVREFIAQRYRRDSLLRDLTNEDETKIDHLTWDYLQTELTWNKIFKETKLDITEGELEWIVTHMPPAQLQKNPDLMTDGKFDTSKYYNLIRNPQNRAFFSQYAREIYEQLRPQKLQMYVAGALLFPENGVNDLLSRVNRVVSVTALYFGPNALTEEEKMIEPTEAELRGYYRQHRTEFQPKEEIRELKFVFFPLTITKEDSQAAQERIEDAYRHLLAADPASLKDSFEMASLMIGDYEPDTVSAPFSASQFFPATESVVRRLRPGQFTKPLATDNGWQIILLDSTVNDTFWVRRIRTRIKPEDTKEIALLDQMRQFIEQAKSTNFLAAAANQNLTVPPTPARVIGRKRLSWPLQIYNQGQLVEWAIRAKPGEIIDLPMRGPQGFYLFQLDRVVPVRAPAFEEVKDALSWRFRQEQERKLWGEKAQQAVQVLKTGKTLEDYAAENPGVELINEEINGLNDFGIRGRRGAEFVGAAMALEKNQTTGPIVTNWGAYIIRCNDLRLSETPVLTAERYLEQKQQQLFQDLWEKVTETPETKDWRQTRGY
ncbi:MAG: peptidyl-prolyl cis-trans isomerase [bacterium]